MAAVISKAIGTAMGLFNPSLCAGKMARRPDGLEGSEHIAGKIRGCLRN
jgi:hypothetical protein